MPRTLLILAGGLALACGTSTWAAPINPTELAGFGGNSGLTQVAAPPTNTNVNGGVTGLASGTGVIYINQFAGLPLGNGGQFKAIGSFLIYLVMLKLLMWRPSGIFGRR